VEAYPVHLRSRALRLIRDAIAFLQLDLDGAIVLTEMGSSHFIYTPFIAAMAGAQRVVAVTKDSKYGRAEEIIAQGRVLAVEWGLSQIISVHELTPTLIGHADIVTNLGFVRPIAASFVSWMKPGAVIPYMREGWEVRPGDVDLEACQAHGVPVMGTWENYPGLGVFDYCGPLLGKLLFEVELEILGNRLIVLSTDPFGPALWEYLRRNGAETVLVRSRQAARGVTPEGLDAVIVADQQSSDTLVGPDGWLDPVRLAEASPHALVLQYAGVVDVESVQRAGLRCIPSRRVGAHRMWRTLAYVGLRPVIDLHTAGLKVGELMWHKMQVLRDATLVEHSLAVESLLCRRVPEGGAE
jgi:hypothetical protein